MSTVPDPPNDPEYVSSDKRLKQSARKAKIGCGAAFAVVVATLIVIMNLGSGSSDLAPNKYQAFIECENGVRTMLKAPSTAKFSDQRFQGNPDDDTDYRVLLAVDSENSFGATLRNEFTCTLKYHETTRDWTVLTIR